MDRKVMSVASCFPDGFLGSGLSLVVRLVLGLLDHFSFRLSTVSLRVACSEDVHFLAC